MKVALLFPGQGAQKVGMLKNMPKEKIILDTIAEASKILKRDVLTLDTKESLKSTNSVQLSLFIYGVAMARFLKENNVDVDITLGHSIGAFAAAVACESMSFEDGLRLIDLRGKLMQRGFPEGYGMGTIVGLNANTIDSLAEKLRDKGEEVYIATINTKNQTTVSGKLSAINKLFDMAKEIGVNKAKILDVSVPSHCILLDSISDEMRKQMQKIEFKMPKAKFVGNCRARVLWKGEDIKEDLIIGIAKTVKFYDGFVNIYERGIRTFIECGPGSVLSNMVKGEFSDAMAISTGILDLESIVHLANK